MRDKPGRYSGTAPSDDDILFQGQRMDNYDHLSIFEAEEPSCYESGFDAFDFCEKQKEPKLYSLPSSAYTKISRACKDTPIINNEQFMKPKRHSSVSTASFSTNDDSDVASTTGDGEIFPHDLWDSRRMSDVTAFSETKMLKFRDVDTTSCSSMQDCGVFDCEGYLDTKDMCSFSPQWTRYWFTLRDDTVRYLDQKGGSLRGSLVLASVSWESESREGSISCRLSGRKLLVRACSNEDAIKWCYHLLDVVGDLVDPAEYQQEEKEESRDPTTKLTATPSLISEHFCTAVRSGWLVKQGRVFKTWRKRYCILMSNGMFSYFEDDCPWKLAKYRSFLVGIHIGSKKANGLQLIFSDGRVMEAYAESPVQRVQWISAVASVRASLRITVL